ncbi:ferritin-like domain-containing protein [Stieleria sp. TO1_6]|uniref:YciE/YciF ferroxidase family protein n=1 Tax=Stieleria tagensis TaxID=2956795 RepID=UPI00209ADD91|nr:ferritin-like domain-containing protein [Stieleria tagensis]MCO8121704.1 ferritin-like domain-containing protein [Stieleria tagensis]
MNLDSLHKLFVHELKDIYSAEKQAFEALGKMQEAATDKNLKASFAKHREETTQHLERLESIFKELEFQPGGHRCMAMEGIINEGEELMKSDIEPHVLDAALISSAQRVEHYEIAAYGTARAFADKLGNHSAADLLQQTLDEEGRTNRDLSRLAERSINFLATKAVVA